MNEEKELEQFKEEFIKGYIHPRLNRLLDLQNTINKANNYDEILALVVREQEFIKEDVTQATLSNLSRESAAKVSKKE